MLKGANGNIINPNTATISDTQRGYVKVVAVYNLLSYRITWDLGSGRFINSFATPSEYKYSIGLKLPASTSVIPPIGHDFNHWEIDGIATTSITKTDYGDKNVVAIYNLSTYHISWNLDDGTTGNHGEWNGTAGNDSYTYGTAYPLPTNVTGPTGRIFNNWEIGGIVATSIPAGSTGDKEIQAKYRNATYSVTWHDADGNPITWASGFTATMSYTYSEGMAMPATESIVAPNTKELDYWIIRRAGETDITHVASIPPTLTGNVEMIAVYKYVTYTINYDTVITGAYIAHDSVERTYGTATTSLITPTKANYKFVGWYRNYDSATHTYTNEYTGNDDIYVAGTKTYTIYAKWKAKVTYNVNGHGSIDPAYVYVDLWDTITLATLSDVTGFTFDLTNSWYDGADISSANLIGSAGADYDVTEPKELYAKWTEKRYKVILHINDGTFSAGYTDFTLDADTGNYVATRSYTESINLPTSANITKNNYNFDGWYGNASLTGTKYTSVAANTDGEKEFWLKWSQSGGGRPGGGGSGGGGGGGGGGVNTAMQDQNVATTYINQKKFIKANVNSKDTAWIYDPITNAFKMNIIIEGQSIPAVDGFYLINKVATQNKNGVTVNVPATDTYYFDKDGKMLTGWIKTTPDNKWYFLETIKNAREGAMAFGWYLVQNKWYYFTKEGSMLVNATTPDGQVVGPDGVWVK